MLGSSREAAQRETRYARVRGIAGRLFGRDTGSPRRPPLLAKPNVPGGGEVAAAVCARVLSRRKALEL